LGFFTTLLICLFFYRQLGYVAMGEHRPPLLTFAEEAVGTFAGFLVFPLFYLVATRFPLVSEDWRRNVLVHLVAVCLISVVHTSIIILGRTTLFPLLGIGQDDYGYLPVRYPMEFAHLFIFYWVGVSLVSLFHEVRFARERELRQAQLEANLAEAQLQNLRLQLEPHFLFNALNAISAAIYENPRAADEMVCRLGDLLRQLLRSDRSQLIPLRRELELVELYIHIMKARLEDRLQVRIEVEESVTQGLVPQLLLQPLVENAIRHGMDPLTFQVNISITAQRHNEELELVVSDHGIGFKTSDPQPTGIGLRNTAERLKKLYGADQTLRLFDGADGGATASILIPFREAFEEHSSLPEKVLA
jgi:hypothetical protein